MQLQRRLAEATTRRHFLKNCQAGLGALAMAEFSGSNVRGAGGTSSEANPLSLKNPHFTPKAKRVIYLHMAGSPPQHELFDYKPKLIEHHMQPCPDEYMKNQRFPFIKGKEQLQVMVVNGLLKIMFSYSYLLPRTCPPVYKSA